MSVICRCGKVIENMDERLQGMLMCRECVQKVRDGKCVFDKEAKGFWREPRGKAMKKR